MSDAPPPPNSLPPPPSSWLKKPKKKAEPAASGADAELAMMLASLQVQLDTQSAVAPRRRKLLVLDVNGLLLWRVFKKGQVDLAKLPPPDTTMGQFLIFARPHLREFLTWCAEHFYIVVWSTTTRKNLDPIVKFAFEGLPPPSAVLDQTDCTDTGVLHPDDTDGSYKLRIKELSKLWADARIQSALGSDYGPSDTILLDDSPYKAVANPEHTALHPKEWAGPTYPDNEVNNALGAGGAVRSVLQAVADAVDVRDVVRGLEAQPDKERHWTSATSDANLAHLHRAGWKPPTSTSSAATVAEPEEEEYEIEIHTTSGSYDAAASASILGMLGVGPSPPPSPAIATAIAAGIAAAIATAIATAIAATLTAIITPTVTTAEPTARKRGALRGRVALRWPGECWHRTRQVSRPAEGRPSDQL